MAAKMMCKIAGHDPDDCGVCKRCGREENTRHEWKEVERDRPCFRRENCGKCGQTREQPDHDWQMGEKDLHCSRCGLSI